MGQGAEQHYIVHRWLREPLVHFLFAGLAVFLFSAWHGEPVDPASRTIAISETNINEFADRFAQIRRRTPTTQEIDGLIRDHIKEEVYYREALRLGLDVDDAIIRRRLRSKMEYLATAAAENAVADTKTLQAWLDGNAARYNVGATYSFDQIYLSSNNAGAARITALKAKLSKGGPWQESGDAISLPRSLDNADTAQIARDFGDDFAAALPTLTANLWSGPVLSGFGSHLVRIRSVQPGRKPVLVEIRQKIENDWRAETARQREAAAYQALLNGYTIRIQKP